MPHPPRRPDENRVRRCAWLTEQCAAVDVPGYNSHFVLRPVTQRGPTRGGICVFELVAERLAQHVNQYK